MNFKAASFDMSLLIRYFTLLIVFAFISVIHGRSEDVEVIFLPSTSSNPQQEEISLAFTAFGHSIELKLHKNRKLVAPSFQVWRHSNRKIVRIPELSEPLSCYYIHSDGASTAAVSLCEKGVINGLVLLDNAALEITPLRETKSIEILDIGLFPSIDPSKEPHVIKRSYLSSGFVFNDSSDTYNLPNGYINFAKKLQFLDDDDDDFFSRKSQRDQIKGDLTIELGVFFDEAAYNLFSPFLDKNEKKIRDMLLAYVNGVQALYHHPSLGTRIDVSLVRLEIMENQPLDLPHYDGERERLLDSFCRYVKNHNPTGDDDPNHWDMGLYVSGLDFYAYENGKKNGVTMGLAPVNGVCYEDYACVIAELGVTNRFGKPYPSAGFTSVYIAAHEIGHNLGMRHDSSDNSCTKDGFIMSPSRGTQGETIWSPCSRSVALKLRETKLCLLNEKASSSSHHVNDPSLDHAARYKGLPGREWTSKRQCELLLRDKDASYVTLNNACQSLQCTSPHRSGYYHAGPALEGTACAQGKECRGGECVPILRPENHQKPTKKPAQSNNNGWSKWKDESCRSGCIVNSKGAKARRRICREPPSSQATTSGCGSSGGFAYDIVICGDEKLCKKRVVVTDFASSRCAKYAEYLTEIDREGGGLQAGHENARPWMACAIFCRRNDIASYYTPRIELNDLGLDPYFPDGTWCHREHDQDYFCLRHHCLPENFTFDKDSSSSSSSSSIVSRYIVNENSILGSQNASPGDYNVPQQIMRYLSLDIDGLPISRTLPSSAHSDDVPPTLNDDDDAWIDKDYLELPDNLNEDFLNIDDEDSLVSHQEFDLE